MKLIVTFFILNLIPIHVQAATEAAVVVSVKGNVLSRNTEISGSALKQLQVGDKIYEGEVINTGSKAMLKVMFTDKTIVDLGPSTLFKVSEYKLKGLNDRNVALSLPYGKIRTSVNRKVGPRGKFRIKTKSATMGVRGTELLVSAPLQTDGNSQTVPKTEVVVLTGKITVNSASSSTPVTLTPGQVLVAEAALPRGIANTAAGASGGTGQTDSSVEMKVESMNQTQMQDTQNSATDMKKDVTFEKAVVIDTESFGSQSGSQTMAAFADNMEAPSELDPSNMGMSGTFGQNFGNTFDNFLGRDGVKVKVNVVFQK